MKFRHRHRVSQVRQFTSLRVEALEERALLAGAPVPSGLVAWWTGDGTALDSVGSSHGILEGGVTFAAGKVGQAFSLDGIDDRIRVLNSAVLNPTDGLTIEGWILSNSTSGSRVVASKWNDQVSDWSYIFKQSSQQLKIELQDAKNQRLPGLGGATSIIAGQWNHVAVTFDTRTARLFFNGVQDASLDLGSNHMLRASAADFLIGATWTGVGENFSGQIDELSLYNRALISTEIQSIYQAGGDGKVKTSAMNVVGSNPAAGSIVNRATTDFVVDFSFAYDVASVQASDFTVNGRAADSFIATDPDTITFHFNISPVTNGGMVGTPQIMAMAAGTISTNLAGVSNPTLAPWTTTFQARLSSPTFNSQLVDLFLGPESSNAADYRGFQGGGNVAFFRASDGISTSLWKTDGTAAGTFKVSTTPDMAHSGDMAYTNGTLFFILRPNGDITQLWKCNGTEVGTALVDTWTASNTFSSSILGTTGNLVYYLKPGSTLGTQLWRSDGTPAGTILLSEMHSGGMPSVILNNRLIFVADDGTHGAELWVSDGTLQGTSIFYDLNPGTATGLYFLPSSTMQALNGFVYFRGKDHDGNLGPGNFGIWKTDGTASGTSLIKKWEGGVLTSKLKPLNSLLGKVYFTDNVGLWVTDGTDNGLALLKALTVTSGLVQVGQNAFFAADDGVHGNALWKTDGTPAGTVMLRAITGSSSAGIGWLTDVNGKLFFTADDALSGNELWESDGTETGTILAKDINPGPNSSAPRNLRSVNNHLVFTADDGVHGYEPWVATSSINALPVARSSPVTAVQETALQITLSATDFDNDPLAYGVIDQPQHGSLSGTAPNLTYTPANNYTGPDTFTFKANDGKADSNLATISITVVSNRPVPNDATAVTKHDKAVAITLSASDPRNLPLTFSVVTTPLHGTLSGNAPNLTYTPAAAYIGADSFTYQVDNGQSTSNVATISINVTPNHAPSVSDSPTLWALTPTIPIVLEGEDEDGDPLTFTIVSAPASGSLTGTPPNLIYTKAAGLNDFVTFTFQASDGEATSNG